METLRFGTAGIPISTPDGGTENGIRHARRLGLGAFELEFVRSINITRERAPSVKKAAKESDIALTCHAPYFINLNSADRAKLAASVGRILDSARIAWLCGGWSVTFHAAFYMKATPSRVYEAVKGQVAAIITTLQNEGNGIWVRPETTGKGSQFGSLDELLKLAQDVEQVMPCVDFSHLHARSGGKLNSYAEFAGILERIETGLGKEGLSNMHIHTSGIEYTAKGERNHLNLEASDMKWKELMRALRDFKVKGVLISESPNIEGDSMMMKKEFLRLDDG